MLVHFDSVGGALPFKYIYPFTLEIQLSSAGKCLTLWRSILVVLPALDQVEPRRAFRCSIQYRQ